MPKCQKDPRGDAKKGDLRVRFDSRMMLPFCGSKVTSDAERLAVDPATRHVVGGQAAQADNEAASTSGVGRFEPEIL